jgi:hypothetical protein
MLAGVALAFSLANWLAVEPHTTGVMLERYELEDAQQRDNDAIKKLYKTFSKWCANLLQHVLLARSRDTAVHLA